MNARWTNFALGVVVAIGLASTVGAQQGPPAGRGGARGSGPQR